MSVSRKIAGNTLVQLAGKAVTTVASLALVALITRSLGVSSYGGYIAVLAYGQFFAVFADLGINVYAVKRLSSKEGDVEREASAMYSIRLIGAVVILGIAALIVPFMPYDAAVKQSIWVVLFAIFAQTVNSLFVSVLQAELEMRYATFSEVAGRISILVFTAAAVLLHGGLMGVILATTAGNVINMVLSYVYAARFVRLRPALDWPLMRYIVRQSLPISITAILSYVYFKVDTVILSAVHLSGGRDSSVELGIYGSAYKVLELLQLIPTIFLGNLFPVLSSYVATDRKKAESLLQKAFNAMALVGFPITATVFILATPLIVFVAGAGFAPAAVPLRILAFAVLLTYFNGLLTYTALALGLQRNLIWVYAAATVFNVALNLIFIPQYSYLAAATTTCLTEVLVLFGAWLVCRGHISFSFSWRRPLHFALLTVILCAVLIPLRSLSILITGPLAVALYAALVLGTKGVTPAEVRSVLRRQV